MGKLALLAVFSGALRAASIGTAFTYQGRLTDGGMAATGIYDFRFTVYDAATGSGVLAGPVVSAGVGVTNGLFVVILDFGTGIFTGNARWLEMAVRTNSAAVFTTLSPRQPVTATPYALYSADAGTAKTVSANGVSNAGLQANAVSTDKIANNSITTAKLSASGSKQGQVLMSQGTSVVWSDGPGLTLPFAGVVSATQPGLTVSNSAGVGIRGTGLDVGVKGEAAALGRGVQGIAVMGTGVYGEGLSFFATGVEGASEHGKGVWGHSTNDSGVFGQSVSSSGVRGDSSSADGVEGHAVVANKSGVYGVSTHAGGFGVTGRGGQAGVQGTSGTGDGVVGGAAAPNKSGVYGFTTSADGYGMYAQNRNADTWVALASKSSAAQGYCGGFIAGLADYGNGAAIYGVHSPGDAPTSFRGATGSHGLVVECSKPYQKAALFVGNVEIQNLSYNTVCELGEGLDYSEGFDVREETETIEPGCVLSIDADHPGKLRLSRKAYDTKVAGIVAGAKGLGSGVRLGGDRFGYPVALAGRVYCNVDASYGPVVPGSLLTTSPTPGHAMVVRNSRRATGAILGKAMEGLQSGKGQILVLVTLQ